MNSLVIYGEVPSMKNTLRVGKFGNFYHASNEVKDYKIAFCEQCPAKYKEEITSQIGVELVIYRKNRRRDGSNQADTVYDALEYSGVVMNDRQIVERHEFDRIDKENPRIEIKFWELPNA